MSNSFLSRGTSRPSTVTRALSTSSETFPTVSVRSPPAAAAAQDAAYAGEQLGRMEGFGQVVVGAEFETLDLVVQRVACRDYDDVVAAPQMFYVLEQPQAAPVGKHYVEQDAVVEYAAMRASASAYVAAVSTMYRSCSSARCITSRSDGSSSMIRIFIPQI